MTKFLIEQIFWVRETQMKMYKCTIWSGKALYAKKTKLKKKKKKKVVPAFKLKKKNASPPHS